MTTINGIQKELPIIFFFLLNIHLLFGEEIIRFSDIEIHPKEEVVDWNSTLSFICINHANNNAPLEVGLSENLSTSQVVISTKYLNQTALSIQLQINDYAGIFNLLCYVKGKKEHGMQSDIVVKPPPSVLRLKEGCKVYQDSYLKCTIRASAYAKAIRNNYPFWINFEEINQPEHSRIYSNMKLLKDETTDEYLVFRWNPTNDRVFPTGLHMKMNITLKHLKPSIYIFDTTPVFVIEPAFQLNLAAQDSISLTFDNQLNDVLCQKSMSEPSQSSSTMTWSDIGDNSSGIIFNKLQSGRTYSICVRCRKKSTDPYGEPVCRQATTMNSTRSDILRVVTTVFLICCGGLLVVLVVCLMSRWRGKINCRKVKSGSESSSGVVGGKTSPTNGTLSRQCSSSSIDTSGAETDSLMQQEDSGYKLLIMGASGIGICFPESIERPN